MYSGIFPFSRASFIFDFIIIAIISIIPLMIFSIHQARMGRHDRHASLQKLVSFLLFGAVLLFEVDMRIWGWRHLAQPSPFYETWLFPALYCHMSCSIATIVLWSLTLWRVRKKDPRVFPESHRRIAKSSFYGLCLTTITGLLFYWLAFVAS
ncbi:MAG: DUF420 domain-containing protein [Oligoflexales bacterium]